MIFDHIQDISQLRPGEAPEGVAGLSELIRYFGHMPDFNDCEVLSVLLDHEKGCVIEIHGWEADPDYYENDEILITKNAIVTFKLHGVSIARIVQLSQSGRLDSLYLMKVEQGFQLILAAALGLDACFTCDDIKVEVHPTDRKVT